MGQRPSKSSGSPPASTLCAPATHGTTHSSSLRSHSTTERLYSTRRHKQRTSRRPPPPRTFRGLFTLTPPTYITPSTPKYLRKLFILHGGSIVSDPCAAQLILVNSLDDPLIPSLYIDKVVVYDCAWVEESFVRGGVLDLKGFAVLPWDYDGPAYWIPVELDIGTGRIVDSLPDIAIDDGTRYIAEAAAGSVVQRMGGRVEPGETHAALGNTDPQDSRLTLSNDEDGDHLPSELDLLQESSPFALSPTPQEPGHAGASYSPRLPLPISRMQELATLRHGQSTPATPSVIHSRFKQSTATQPSRPLSKSVDLRLSPTLRNRPPTPFARHNPTHQQLTLAPNPGPLQTRSPFSSPVIQPEVTPPVRDANFPKRKPEAIVKTQRHPSKRYRSTTPLCEPPLSLTIGNKPIIPIHAVGPARHRQTLQPRHPNVVHPTGKSSAANLSAWHRSSSKMPFLQSGPQAFIPGKTTDADGAIDIGPPMPQTGSGETPSLVSRPAKKTVRGI